MPTHTPVLVLAPFAAQPHKPVEEVLMVQLRRNEKAACEAERNRRVVGQCPRPPV